MPWSAAWGFLSPLCCWNILEFQLVVSFICFKPSPWVQMPPCFWVTFNSWEEGLFFSHEEIWYLFELGNEVLVRRPVITSSWSKVFLRSAVLESSSESMRCVVSLGIFLLDCSLLKRVLKLVELALYWVRNVYRRRRAGTFPWSRRDFLCLYVHLFNT